jgi:phthalate 4,5-dioxygenase oxygenase subunit
MRPIVDRSREHLGQADLAVIHYRALLIAAVRAVQEGRNPLGIGNDFPADEICSVVTIAPAETPWRELGLPLAAETIRA